MLFVLAVDLRDLSQAGKSIIRVTSFPKLSDGWQNFFFLSLNNWGLNFLQNECSQSSQIYNSPEKLRKMFFEFLNEKIYQNINFAKLPSAK